MLDRRIQKTLHYLQKALAELIAEKDYDDITIQDILDRANVGRSTFYAHFENKDQLVRSILELLNERYEEGIRRMGAGQKAYETNSDHMPFGVLQFVEQHQDLFKAMLGKQGHKNDPNPFADYLFVLTREHFRQMLRPRYDDTLRIEMAAHYYANALIGAMVWWLENDRVYPAEDFAQYLNQLTLPGVKAVFGE